MAIVEGVKYWTDNEPVRGFDANAYLMSQSVMRFDNATDRDSALARSLTSGMIAYDKSTTTLQLYDGTSWIDVATGTITGGGDGQILYNNGGAFNGASALYYDDVNNRVGIGTPTPSVALHVDSGSTDQYAAPQIYVAPSGHASSDRAAIQLDDIQLLTDIYGNGTADFSIYSNNAAAHRFSIDGSGNVGIGTPTPSAPLEIQGAVGAVRIEPTVLTIGSNNDGYEFNIVGGTPDSFTNAGGRIRLGGGARGDGDVDNIIFLRDNIESMRIDSSGNVGIGDPTPSYRLDVNGDINATGSIRKNGTPIYGLQVAQTTVSATSSFAYYLLNMPSGVNIYNLVSISPVEGVNNRLHIAEVALGNWSGIQTANQILIYCRLGSGVHLDPYHINFYYRV